MISKVAPSEANGSVIGFDGNILPSTLLLLSTDDGCYFSCASIERIILFLSVLVFLIFFSNTVPCNFVQINVLYQGPYVIQSGLFLSKP